MGFYKHSAEIDMWFINQIHVKETDMISAAMRNYIFSAFYNLLALQRSAINFKNRSLEVFKSGFNHRA